MRSLRFVMAAAAALLTSVPARAEMVHIEAGGIVEFNSIQGSMMGVQRGDPVLMSFFVDSNNFVNSVNFPTRGYVIDLDSFMMTVAGRPVPIIDPQPAGRTAYFVLRDNDPVVDGFFLSANVDFPFPPVAVSIPGLVPDHELNFLATYTSGQTLSSLDILDAVGTYTTAGISSYDWTIGRFGTAGAGYEYQTLTISAPIPEPTSLSLLVVGSVGLVTLIRRRRRSDRHDAPEKKRCQERMPSS